MKKSEIAITTAPVYHNFLNLFLKGIIKKFALRSGRGAGKSTLLYDLSIFMVWYFGSVIWFRANYNSIRDSIYNGIKERISDLELDDWFEFKLSPLVIICKKTGYAIQFKGLQDFQRNKGLVPIKGKFVLCVFEETQEIVNESFCAEVVATLARGKSKDCKIVYLFNPPPNSEHWVNQQLVESVPDYMYCLKTCYTDLPEEWLGEQFIQDAERLKETNNKLFRYRYMGDPVNAEDEIFENLKLQEIGEESIDRWLYDDQNLYVGLDFGYKPDPNAANMMYYDFDSRILYIFKEFERGQLNNLQISEGLENAGFLKEYKIVCDNVDKDIADLRSFGWDAVPAIKGPGSRDKGFKWLCGLSQIVIDPVRCPRTAHEFESYVYKANKEGSIVGLFPEGQDDHHIAAVRYAMEEVWRRKGV